MKIESNWTVNLDFVLEQQRREAMMIVHMSACLAMATRKRK
jgi:hypothetical protein